MQLNRLLKPIACVSALGVLAAIGLFTAAPRVRAADPPNDDESKIKRGFEISPVTPNLTGKNHALVGYGSYLVNAVADCNGCHSDGTKTEFSPGGNPYFNQHPTVVNPMYYLGGGRDFGPLPAPGFADIVSRNLTPDKSGKPEGHTYQEFVQIMRHGTDLDGWHPTCTGPPDGHCVPAPFDGALLQVMPWPIHSNMTDHDLRAIYTYLSAIPCLEGDPGNPVDPDTHGHRCK